MFRDDRTAGEDFGLRFAQRGLLRWGAIDVDVNVTVQGLALLKELEKR